MNRCSSFWSRIRSELMAAFFCTEMTEYSSTSPFGPRNTWIYDNPQPVMLQKQSLTWPSKLRCTVIQHQSGHKNMTSTCLQEQDAPTPFLPDAMDTNERRVCACPRGSCQNLKATILSHDVTIKLCYWNPLCQFWRSLNNETPQKKNMTQRSNCEAADGCRVPPGSCRLHCWLILSTHWL